MCFKHMQTMYCSDDFSDYEQIRSTIKLNKCSSCTFWLNWISLSCVQNIITLDNFN